MSRQRNPSIDYVAPRGCFLSCYDFFALAKEFFEEYSVVLEKKSGLMTKLQSAADMQIMLADGRSLLQKNYTEGVQS